MVFTFVRLALAGTWDQCKTLEECHISRNRLGCICETTLDQPHKFCLIPSLMSQANT